MFGAPEMDYDEMIEDVCNQMISMRKLSNQTHKQIAKKMHTTQSVICRLEKRGGKKAHSPSLKTLMNYAEAINCDIEIKLISRRKKPEKKPHEDF